MAEMNTDVGDYEKLIEVTITQAQKDHIKYLKKFNKNVEDGLALLNIMAIERFFRSQWFEDLTTIDPEQIIEFDRSEHLREEVRNIGRSVYDG